MNKKKSLIRYVKEFCSFGDKGDYRDGIPPSVTFRVPVKFLGDCGGRFLNRLFGTIVYCPFSSGVKVTLKAAEVIDKT